MFKECTEERWDEMLGVLPPALWIAKGFLVGEPFDHRTCKITAVVRATYAAFINHGDPTGYERRMKARAAILKSGYWA